MCEKIFDLCLMSASSASPPPPSLRSRTSPCPGEEQNPDAANALPQIPLPNFVSRAKHTPCP